MAKQCHVSNFERDCLEYKFQPLLHEEFELGGLVSFVGNKKIPLLRLYRYKEAFAFDFVRVFLNRFGLTSQDYAFDPFAGMGTTLFTSTLYGIPSIGLDRLPIATFVAETIHQLLFTKPGSLHSTFELLQRKVDRAEPASIAMDVPIIKLAFPENILFRLRQWKGTIDTLSQPLRNIFLLVII